MIKPCTILDLSTLSKLMSRYEGYDCFDYVHWTLQNPYNHWFYNEELRTCMFYEARDNQRYEMHIYGTSPGTKEMKKWCISTGKYVLENGAKVLINWVRKDQKRLRFFMASMRAKKAAEIGDEILYHHTLKDYNRMRGL